MVAELFLGHALCESEHRVVVFDVYRAVGGTERMRRVVMNVITAGVIGGVALAVVLSLLGDRAARNPVRLARSVKRLSTTPIVSRELWRELPRYNRHGDHPSGRDAVEIPRSDEHNVAHPALMR